jgi:hypothetical protein
MNRAIRVTSLIALCVWLGLGPLGCSRNKQEARTDTQSQSPSTQEIQVSKVDLGRNVGSDKRVTDPTTEFHPNETIYATVLTNGSAPNATVTARWTYQDGQIVEETTQAVAPGTDAATEFHISKPDGWPAGKYKLEVLVNGTPAATKEFEVKTQS